MVFKFRGSQVNFYAGSYNLKQDNKVLHDVKQDIKLTTLWANKADDNFMIFFLFFFPENKI